MHPLLEKEHTGAMLPLFSMRYKHDWGIGDISGIGPWTDVLASLNLDLLQLLPVNEMPPGVSCPYTALSAFAIDPIYIAVGDIPELAECHELKEEIAAPRFQASLRHLHRSRTVRYDDVEKLKLGVLRKIYSSFHERHILKNTVQAGEFFAFVEKNSFWLNDYALFRHLKDARDWASWTHWEEPLRRHDGEALKQYEAANENQVLFFKYLQWVIDRQWRAAKIKAESNGVLLMGDLPFMVDQESADVWARQNEFDIRTEVGAPPDAFSETGQRWGLPACRWEEAGKNDFEWWRRKVQRSEDLYHIFRIDHMVGFFRTWIIPRDSALKPGFDIRDEHEQRARGKRFLEAVSRAGRMLPVAEDLGVIPPFVREVMSELNIPGYKIMRWEKKPDGNYTEPENYPRISLATSSTHDNEPLADWWDTVYYPEKQLFWTMISGSGEKPPIFSKCRDAVIRKLLKAASVLVVLPIQDILGVRDRINVPGTVSGSNWTYKIPCTAESILTKYGPRLNRFAAMVKEERK
jgi:4-alpha-glucanotransferase